VTQSKPRGSAGFETALTRLLNQRTAPADQSPRTTTTDRRGPYSRRVHTTQKRPFAALVVSGLLLALTLLSLQAPAQAARTTTSKAGGFFAGHLVNPKTGNPVKGVTVKVFRINTDTLLGHATTGPEGNFRIDGLSAADEELDVRANGRAVNYETGWFGCNRTIVQSWGAACSWGQGRQGTFKIQHL
jgi:hypothetical protein